MGLTTAEKGLISQMLRFNSVNNELKTKLVDAEQLIASFAEAVAKDEARRQELDQRETALRARETALEQHQQRVTAELEAESLKKEQQLQKLDETLTRKREVATIQAEQQIQKLNKEFTQKREAATRQLEKLLEEQSKRFPWLASAIADLAMLKNNEVADYLRTKRNPAFAAADTVRQVNQGKRNLTEQLKLAQYTLAQYESLFPRIDDYREEGADEALLALSEAGESPQQDPVSSFLSSEEYAALSPAERNQRALALIKSLVQKSHLPRTVSPALTALGGAQR